MSYMSESLLMGRVWEGSIKVFEPIGYEIPTPQNPAHHFLRADTQTPSTDDNKTLHT